MSKMEIDTNTDDTGALRIQIPGRPARYQVKVTVEWTESQELSAWPPGWIEATAGSITDPTFIRHPQGDYEEREELS